MQSRKSMKHTYIRYRPIVVAVVLSFSAVLWLFGLSKSPIGNPNLFVERQLAQRYNQQHSPDLQSTRTLAEAYWNRYRDVREHDYYGKNGKMGIYGAEEHFKHHGRGEGRIYGPVPLPERPLEEPGLAEAYWQRYPDIERSATWGRRSTLGILGPRDHYHYLGKNQGRVWGQAVPDNGN